MPWRLRLTDMLGRALRRWQPERRRLNSGAAMTELASAEAVGVPGRSLRAPPARHDPSGPGVA